MKDKNLPPDNSKDSLEELTDQANKIIETLENEKDLNNSIENYQQLLKLNKSIEKKFYTNLKSINEKTNEKVKKILKKNEKISLFDQNYNVNFVKEIIDVLKILRLTIDNSIKIKYLKDYLGKNKNIFKKFNGVGMNYFVGYKS